MTPTNPRGEKASKNPVVRLSGSCYNLLRFLESVFPTNPSELTRHFKFVGIKVDVFLKVVLETFIVSHAMPVAVTRFTTLGYHHFRNSVRAMNMPDRILFSNFGGDGVFISHPRRMFCHLIFNERLTRSIYIIANRVLILDHFVSRVGLSRAIFYQKMSLLDQQCSHIFRVFKNRHLTRRSKIATIDYPQEYLAII